MSKIMISELTEAESVQTTDYIAIDNGESTKKITVENFEETASESARSYAEAAAQSASDAADSAGAASTTSDEVALQVNRAASLAGQAESYANAASTSAGQAATSASTANTQAGIATTKATEAASAAASIGNEVALAQSWAVGGTGARPDEATNNAKYYAESAAAAAGGGVTSFNGRGGIVSSQAGDYSSNMITHTKGSSTTNVATELGAIEDEIDAINKPIKYEGTLEAGDTSISFTVTGLQSTSLVSVYTSVFGVSPTAITESGTTITLTFDEQESDLGVSLCVII